MVAASSPPVTVTLVKDEVAVIEEATSVKPTALVLLLVTGRLDEWAWVIGVVELFAGVEDVTVSALADEVIS